MCVRECVCESVLPGYIPASSYFSSPSSSCSLSYISIRVSLNYVFGIEIHSSSRVESQHSVEEVMQGDNQTQFCRIRIKLI